jgi:quinol monooxygenase YgiN
VKEPGEAKVLVLIVDVKVKKDRIEDFKKIILENALASSKEPGITGFDVVQSEEDGSHFILIEAYKSKEAHLAHRETAHYLKFRDQAEAMMAEPRKGLKYINVFPDDEAWRNRTPSR